MSADETTLDAGQLDFAGYLGLLDPKAKASPVMKEIAIAKLAELYMASQQIEAAQADELAASRNLIGVQADSLVRLREYQRRVMDAAAPDGYAIVDEALIPGLRSPQTSAEEGIAQRVINRIKAEPVFPVTPLRLVKPEGPKEGA